MFRVLKKDAETRARIGVLETPHGVVETPAYVLVGTHAKVRTLDAADLKKAGTQLIIANTYHLWQTLGEDGLKKFPGLHAVMGWDGPLMTDSGGFQVFSFGAAREYRTGKVLNPHSPPSAQQLHDRIDVDVTTGGQVKITDDGAVFTASGKRQWLDAEKSIRIQQQLGADIILAFDEPTSPLHDYAYTKTALGRTHAWAIRSLDAKTSDQLLYGIAQGGPFSDLRKTSAGFISSLPFDGIAVGGSYGNSFGGTRAGTLKELDWTVPYLPEGKPRHLLGIGLIGDIFAGVAAGMDTFDCVVPTREARHGSIWTRRGRVDITRGIYRDDKGILDEECECAVCGGMRLEKGALHSLFKSKNMEAGRLATLHNVSFFNTLMAKIRRAIREGEFGEFRAGFLPDNG